MGGESDREGSGNRIARYRHRVIAYGARVWRARCPTAWWRPASTPRRWTCCAPRGAAPSSCCAPTPPQRPVDLLLVVTDDNGAAAALVGAAEMVHARVVDVPGGAGAPHGGGDWWRASSTSAAGPRCGRACAARAWSPPRSTTPACGRPRVPPRPWTRCSPARITTGRARCAACARAKSRTATRAPGGSASGAACWTPPSASGARTRPRAAGASPWSRWSAAESCPPRSPRSCVASRTAAETCGARAPPPWCSARRRGL